MPVYINGVEQRVFSDLTGRWSLDQAKDMALNKIMVGQGAGSSPVEEDKPSPGLTIVLKTADEQVNSSAVLQDDDELFQAVGTNEVWLLDFYIYVSQGNGNTTDFKFAFTVPAGTTYVYTCTMEAVGGVVTDHAAIAGSKSVDVTALEHKIVHVKVIVDTAGTAGNVQLQWAQNDATDLIITTVEAGSCLLAYQLS